MTKPLICPVCRQKASVCRARAIKERGPSASAAQRQAVKDLRKAGYVLPAAFFRGGTLEALRKRGWVAGLLCITLTPAGRDAAERWR